MTKRDRVNILVFDEEPSRFASYESALADLGENLIRVGSTGEAIGVLLRTDVAVVLIGADPTGSEGRELAQTIRQHQCFEKIAIIFPQKNPREAADCVTPPWNPRSLRAKVGAYVDLYRKTRAKDVMNESLDQRAKERTDKLIESEAQLKMRARLLDIATEAIIVRDLNGLITFWNAGAEKTYGWTREEALGRQIHQLLQTSFTVPFEQIKKELSDNHSWHGRLTQSRKNGERIILDCRKTTNEEGDSVLEVNRDITAEIKAEEVLRATEKLAAMGRVAGIIAHEINNPLAAITNIFYLLRNHPMLAGEPRELVERAEQELERVSHITRQTLSFYRESKQPIMIFVPELLDDVLELQQRLLQENKITVRRKYLSAAPVTGFPAELRQVFLNLVGNAIQAMPEGGVLGVSVRESTDWTKRIRGTMVSIVDTGVGIQPEDAGKLFQPFFSTKSTKGTGMGLWISRGIVQKYDGRITFRSIMKNSGNVTCFRIFLPGIGAFERARKPETESATVKVSAAR